jgi:hypothetical protein
MRPTVRPPGSRPVLLALLALAPLVVVAPAAARAQEDVDRLTLASKVYGDERTVLVRTPPGYAAGTARFPVLYLTDGETHLFHTAATVRYLARAGRMPEMIVVAIVQKDRTSELTPAAGYVQLEKGNRREVKGGGGADRFLSFVETELIPAVEARYRTLPFRALAGHSFGGLFALHTLHVRPELFQARIVAAATYSWEGDALSRKTAALLAARPALRGALVFTLGDEHPEALAGFRRLEAALAAARPAALRWKAILYPDDDHGSVVMPSHHDALRFVFHGWSMPVARDGVGPKGGLRAVEQHFAALSDRLGFQVPIPENVLNLAGYQALADGDAPGALRAFRRNVELHAQSPNVHDSLGEALEREGDLAGARNGYARAWELGRAAKDPNTAAFEANLRRVTAALGTRPVGLTR